MGTPVFSDKALDACIARALAVEPALTRDRQQRAWERVRQRAEQQVQLPPEGESRMRAWGIAFMRTGRSLLRLIRTLISNDEALLRAHARPCAFQPWLRSALHGGFVFAG